MIEFEENITTDDMKVKSFYLDDKGANIKFKSSKNLLLGDLVQTIINEEKLIFRVNKICSEDEGTMYEAKFIDDSITFMDKYIKNGLLSYDSILGSLLQKVSKIPSCVYVIVDGYKKLSDSDLLYLRRKYKSRIVVVNAISIYSEGMKDFVNTFLNKEDFIVILDTKDKKLINYFYTNCKKQYRDNIVIADF